MLEKDILHTAINSLKKATELSIDFVKSKNKKADRKILIDDWNKNFWIEVKRDVHKSTLPSILQELAYFDEPLLLVAENISKGTREILRKENINYLDVSGNCLIKTDHGYYIFIDGRKKDKALTAKKYPAFKKNGIKLIFALLHDETLVNQSYSMIAEAANISKSTIGNILEGLKEKDFLIQLNQGEKKLINRKELFIKWVEAYNEKLKPKLYRGHFSTKSKNWKEIKLTDTVNWGGEPAAYLQTKYLRPELLTLYTNEDQNTLIKKMGLYPNPKDGTIEIYDVFWNPEKIYFNSNKKQTVSPLLTYADLIGTSDNRNFETAQKIYEKYLSTYFTE